MSKKLTADTITDEQICEVRAIAHGSHFTNRNDAMIETCDIARGWIAPVPCLNTDSTHDCASSQIRAARALCAEILNARKPHE